MTEKTSIAAQLDRATEMVREAARDEGEMPSEVDRHTLVMALVEDLDATAQLGAEERLAKVEAQTQVLAEAVIAISQVSVGIAPAIVAVKAEM